MAKIYAENAGSQTIFGITGKFKVNPAVLAVKRNRKTSVIQLGKVKPQMSTVLAFFVPVINGTHYSGTDFIYEDPSKTLCIQSVSGIGGIAELTGTGAGYAIPLTYIPNKDRVVATNLHPMPTYLSGS